MAQFILVVDDQNEVPPRVEEAVAGSQLEVVTATDLAEAKRRLVQATPRLILSSIAFLDDPEGGFRFCRELQEHSSLSSIPVLLVGEESGDDIVSRLDECGAKGFLPSELSGSDLKTRMSALMPKLFQAPAKPQQEQPKAATPKQQKPPAPAAPVAPAAPAAAPAASVSVEQAKLQLAQQLMAKVLHSLKTSDLLAIVELEDVPRVVAEMAKKVCALQAEEFGKTLDGQDTPAEKPSDSDTELDLDSVFGMK